MEKKHYKTDEQGNYIVKQKAWMPIFTAVIYILWIITFLGAMIYVSYSIIGNFPSIQEIIGNKYLCFIYAFYIISIIITTVLMYFMFFVQLIDIKHKRPYIFIGKDRIDVLKSSKRRYESIEYCDITETKVMKWNGTEYVCIYFREGENSGTASYKTKVGERDELPCYSAVPYENRYSINTYCTVPAEQINDFITEKLTAWRENHSTICK